MAEEWIEYCSFCSKDFDISNMGCSALTSHVSGKKHSEISVLKSWKYFLWVVQKQV